MCDCDRKSVTGDSLETKQGERLFDQSADAWLLARALGHLHADEADAEGQHDYRQAIELLGRCSRASATVAQILGRASAHDVPLRWGLLHVLADVGDGDAVGLFAEVAAAPIDDAHHDRRACESPNDGERLVRVMAVEGLARLARGDEDARRALEAVVAEQPDAAVRSAAVQALRALDPEVGSRLADVLPQDQRWMLEVRTAAIHELVPEIEASERAELVRRPPTQDRVLSRPRIKKEC